VTFGHVAGRADATRVFHWEADGDEWTRHFDGTEHAAGSANVYIAGWQSPDGSAERRVSVGQGDADELTADAARQLAALLVEAANELDRLK
jgi:hypothetical protein